MQAPSAPPFDPAALGLVAGERLVERTGRTWTEWLAILDAWGAGDRTHTEIARHLREAYGIPGWWAQAVTVGYERARGRRAVHERPGGFAVGVSRTIAVPVERLFAALADPAWPAPGALRLRTAQTPRTARFDSEDGGRVAAYVAAKGDAKSVVTIEHERLPDAEAVERMRAYWRERLAELKRALEDAA